MWAALGAAEIYIFSKKIKNKKIANALKRSCSTKIKVITI